MFRPPNIFLMKLLTLFYDHQRNKYVVIKLGHKNFLNLISADLSNIYFNYRISIG